MQNRIGILFVAILYILVTAGLYNLRIITKQLEANLHRELSREFYAGKVYRDLQSAIDRCEPLYTRWGGKFSFDEINVYLGFFEDLGLYYKKGVLSLESIGETFGYAILEASEYPEVRRYIAGVRVNAKEKEALVEFENLSNELKKDPKRKEFLANLHVPCVVQNK